MLTKPQREQIPVRMFSSLDNLQMVSNGLSSACHWSYFVGKRVRLLGKKEHQWLLTSLTAPKLPTAIPNAANKPRVSSCPLSRYHVTWGTVTALLTHFFTFTPVSSWCIRGCSLLPPPLWQTSSQVTQDSFADTTSLVSSCLERQKFPESGSCSAVV